MARQQFYQPNRRRRDDMHTDSTDWQPSTSGRSQSVSNGAQNTLDNIDNVLRQNEENPGFYNPQGDAPAKGAPATGAVLAAAEAGGTNGSLFNPSDAAPSRKLRDWLGQNRKKTIAGGLIALTLGGGFFGFASLSQAAVLVQLSKTLQHPFARNSADSSNRLGRSYRYAKTGDVGEARVNVLDSTVFAKTIGQLKDVGVAIERNPVTGAPTRTTIDTDKLRTNFPELEGMDSGAAKAFLANRLGLPADQITGSGTKFTVDQTDFDLKTSRLLTKNTVSLLDDGNIIAAMKSRALAAFFNLPSLFHPIKRSIADKENQIVNDKLRQQQEQQDEQQREKGLTDPIQAEGEAAVTDVKEKNSTFNSGAAKVLLVTGGACLAYSTSNDIIKIDRDMVVLPSVIRAVDIVAAGSQIQAGQDLSAQQVGELVAGLGGIWGGQALQAINGDGSANTDLTDLPQQYKQAFSGSTTAATIKSGVQGFFSTASGGTVSAGAACSPAGLVIQAGVTLAGAALSAFGEAASAGTLTPAFVGLFAAKQAANVAVSAFALHFIEKFILGKTTVKLAENAFSGPIGGDLLAYGARAAANVAAIASGGIALGNNASTLFAASQQQQAEQQFKSQSFFARMFNIYDSRSLAGKLAEDVSPNLAQNVFKVTGSLTNIGNMMSRIFSSIIPSASAGATPYNWDFPQYGLPDVILNDPNVADPYANADYVAKNLLDKNAKDTHGMSYISKAGACFGVNITKSNTDGKWDVLAVTDVNPADTGYTNAHCNELADDNWRRMIAFVFDTRNMEAAACYEDDAPSCADIYMNSGGDDTGSVSYNAPSEPGVASMGVYATA